ncbi:hypothetical protein FA95DRAFT_1614912 [Auriscalpium vulgare]|uniref:Uncharacterized protein n=1 Tax=Auriscalpium vulgare TaxID=40419 RepID=A0ACB8SD93_9AGAM|nr:hypothetical protein FA95DRAFT_1614912 [Auriscalpium vulgare]
MSGPSPATLPPKQQPAYEFMRRKHWADLLITEVSEAVNLVLSPDFKVLFCNRTVHELLGWKDEELLDADLMEIMNVDDRDSFRSMCTQSITDRQTLLTYVRLRCKSEYYPSNRTAYREVLVELRANPHFNDGGDECQCLVAAAKQYPSRSTATLNTFEELRQDESRLQKRVNTLRSQINAQTSRSAAPYGLDDVSAQIAASLGLDTASGEASQSYYPYSQQGYSDASYPATGALPRTVGGDEDDSRKKKVRVQPTAQYVCYTCGRTDSPEWRRGSRGPKTLCNACGLRWAKKRKTEGATEGSTEPAQKVQDESMAGN